MEEMDFEKLSDGPERQKEDEARYEKPAIVENFEEAIEELKDAL